MPATLRQDLVVWLVACVATALKGAFGGILLAVAISLLLIVCVVVVVVVVAIVVVVFVVVVVIVVDAVLLVGRSNETDTVVIGVVVVAVDAVSRVGATFDNNNKGDHGGAPSSRAPVARR